ITQTVRNFAASIGLAVYGTVLTHTTITKVDETLRAKGVPEGASHDAAESIAQSVTGQADSRGPSGSGPVAETVRDSMSAIRMDFAEANQWVFYGMAIALAVAFLISLRHPGTRVTGNSSG
ncbi:MFS transporter, partial [Streptomyces anulatus]